MTQGEVRTVATTGDTPIAAMTSGEVAIVTMARGDVTTHVKGATIVIMTTTTAAEITRGEVVATETRTRVGGSVERTPQEVGIGERTVGGVGTEVITRGDGDPPIATNTERRGTGRIRVHSPAYLYHNKLVRKTLSFTWKSC